MGPFLVIVAGHPHSGKTSLVQRFVDEALRSNLQVTGILAPGKIENGRRSGFNIVDLASKRTFPLSRRLDIPDATGVPYTFYDEGLAAGRRALDPRVCNNADIIVVDEVGPVELNDRGWADRLVPLLAMSAPIIHIWVITKNFVNQVCTKFGIVPKAIIDVGSEDAFDQLCNICIRT